MDKVEMVKTTYKTLYAAGPDPSMVAVPELAVFAASGEGDPRGSAVFEAATGALYACSYGLKMGSKKAGRADWTVMPLEGDWWTDDMARFSLDARGIWKWTLYIVQPSFVPDDEARQAIEDARRKKGLEVDVRFERAPAHKAAHIMHRGPYSAEPPTIKRLHGFIESSGVSLTGRHREIYLSDPRRTAPERMKTIIRQPVA